MKCPRCQAHNDARQKFCGECGSRLLMVCDACESINSPDRKFCGECGAALPQAGNTAALESAESQTFRQSVERIVASKAIFEGERKEITALFADIRGSTELIMDRDPEEARQLLDPVIERMKEAVQHYGGTVNQVTGDGIMALFGAPIAHEDHSIRACYAALRMQDSVKRYTNEFRDGEAPLRIRVGLNSGEVIVHWLSSDFYLDYTAVGETIHLAARMEQMAIPGTIFATARTFREAGPYVIAKALGEHSVRGLRNPVGIYEILGAQSIPSRFPSAVVQGLTPFVGRGGELAQLFAALDSVRSGRGQVLAINGPPGIGKSRLLWEFTHSHAIRDCFVVQSRAVSFGKLSPYRPLSDLLKAYFGILQSNSEEEIREKIYSKVLSLDQNLAPTLAPLMSFLDASSQATDWISLDPLQRRVQTIDAIKRLFVCESLVQPLILAFEDLHWIDSETQAVLDALVEILPSAKILLLVNYRPDYRHEWENKAYYIPIHMEPLSLESMEELLDALLGRNTTLDLVKRRLVERAEGNPFFLEEILQSLLETKLLIGSRGGYYLTKPIEDIRVPATIRTVLAARIDRLPALEKRLVQSASVIGMRVPHSILQAIAEMSNDELRRSLVHLQSAEILYQAALFPEVEYRFKHPLTHEVAYTSLLLEQRHALHERIGRAIEQIYSDLRPQHVEELARHFFSSEAWEKAATYERLAGRNALFRAAYREAAHHLENGLTALDHLPQSNENLLLGIDFLLDLRNALNPLGELEAIVRNLRRARSLAHNSNDKRRSGWISGYLSAHLWALGRYHDALEGANELRALATELGDRELSVYANLSFCWIYHSVGNYSESVNHGEQALQSLEAPSGNTSKQFIILSSPAVIAHSWMALSFAQLGNFHEAIGHGESAVDLAEAAGAPWGRVSACLALGGVYLCKGNHEAAAEVLKRGLEIVERFNVPVWSSAISASLAHAYASCGRVGEAIGLLAQAIEQTPVPLRLYHTLAHLWLSEAYLLVDRLDDARKEASATLTLCEELGEAGNRAHALRALGAVAAKSSREPGEARRFYKQAFDLAAALRMKPLMAGCYVGLSQLTEPTVSQQESTQYRSLAKRLFTEMGVVA